MASHAVETRISRRAIAAIGILALASAIGPVPTQAAPPLAQARDSRYLHGVDMVSTVNAWAVGWHFDGVMPRTLICRWDGSTWTEVPDSVAGGFLRAVSATSASKAWAVGHTDSGTLALRWNGTKWRQVPTAGIPGELHGVAATSEDDVWSVGYKYVVDHLEVLTAHWDGDSWTEVPAPSPGRWSELSSVSMVSANDGWAAGYWIPKGEGYGRSLILHWDGSTWSRMRSPTPAWSSGLSGVTSIATDDAWAAGGSYNGGTGRSKDLIVHWDGAGWSKVKSPTPPPGGAETLTAISAAASDSVWAVGVEQFTTQNNTVITGWDGERWERVESPSPPPLPYLYAVSALSPTDAWAVGNDYSGDLSPMFVHWDGSTWSQF